MTKFFNKLPTINYNGVTAKNFLARAKLSEQTVKDRTLFYPYTMDETDRIDVISHKYYKDSDYTWLIWLTNNVIDPYHDLYVQDDNFNKFIANKYGSIANAQIQIAFYRNNWANDDSNLTPSSYDSLLPNLKKYFTPVTDIYNTIYSYERKKEDWIVNTNKIVSMSVANTTGTFAIGERIQQTYSNNQITANAFVTFSNTSTLTVKHVDGSFIASNTSVVTTITGLSTSYVANAQTVSMIASNIPDTEYTYWAPITYFDYETELNFASKEIMLIDNRYKGTMESQLKKIMST